MRFSASTASNYIRVTVSRRYSKVKDGKHQHRELKTLSVCKGYALERDNHAVDAEARGFSLPAVNATDSTSPLLRTRITWIGNSIGPWTNWSVCKGGAKAKMSRHRTTSIWKEVSLFAR
jgi:hypothetical protein